MMSNTLRAYATAVVLAALVGLSAWWLGDEPAAIFHKVLIAPLFLLAAAGLRHHFPPHLDATRGIAATIEFHVMAGLIIAAFVQLVGVFGPIPLVRQIEIFLAMGVGIGGINAAVFLLRRHRLQR